MKGTEGGGKCTVGEGISIGQIIFKSVRGETGRKTEDVCRRMPQEGGDEEKNENRGTGGSVMKRKTATMSD